MEKIWEGFYQQGDVLLHKCVFPSGLKLKAKRKGNTHMVLVEGEATGHAHRIVDGDVELFEKNGVTYLRVNSETAKLAHEEHDLRETVRNFGSIDSLSDDVREYLETLDLDLDKPFEELVEDVPRETIIEQGEYMLGIVQQVDHMTQRTENVRD